MAKNSGSKTEVGGGGKIHLFTRFSNLLVLSLGYKLQELSNMAV
jgi:hypothetical protein